MVWRRWWIEIRHRICNLIPLKEENGEISGSPGQRCRPDCCCNSLTGQHRSEPFCTPAGDMNPYVYLCAGWNFWWISDKLQVINLITRRRWLAKVGNEYVHNRASLQKLNTPADLKSMHQTLRYLIFKINISTENRIYGKHIIEVFPVKVCLPDQRHAAVIFVRSVRCRLTIRFQVFFNWCPSKV